jgi:hypothetical protein
MPGLQIVRDLPQDRLRNRLPCQESSSALSTKRAAVKGELLHHTNTFTTHRDAHPVKRFEEALHLPYTGKRFAARETGG